MGRNKLSWRLIPAGRESLPFWLLLRRVRGAMTTWEMSRSPCTGSIGLCSGKAVGRLGSTRGHLSRLCWTSVLPLRIISCMVCKPVCPPLFGRSHTWSNTTVSCVQRWRFRERRASCNNARWYLAVCRSCCVTALFISSVLQLWTFQCLFLLERYVRNLTYNFLRELSIFSITVYICFTWYQLLAIFLYKMPI